MKKFFTVFFFFPFKLPFFSHTSHGRESGVTINQRKPYERDNHIYRQKPHEKLQIKNWKKKKTIDYRERKGGERQQEERGGLKGTLPLLHAARIYSRK